MAEHVALLISEPETPVALVLALQLTKEMVARLCERERHSPSSRRGGTTSIRNPRKRVEGLHDLYGSSVKWGLCAAGAWPSRDCLEQDR
jgi:hypothetical protein